MTELIVIFVGTVFVNNFVLVRFLGLCPFLGVSQNLEAAAGMSLATAFVLTLSSATAYLLQLQGLADEANRYIDEKKPWIMAKDEDQFANVQGVCTQGINLFRSLMIYLTPVIPSVADATQSFLGEDDWCWDDASTPLLATTISTFTPLLTRVEPDHVRNMVEQSKQS